MEAAGRGGPAFPSPFYTLLSLQIPGFEGAVVSGVESPRIDPTDPEPVPKTCPQPAVAGLVVGAAEAAGWTRGRELVTPRG